MNKSKIFVKIAGLSVLLGLISGGVGIAISLLTGGDQLLAGMASGYVVGVGVMMIERNVLGR